MKKILFSALMACFAMTASAQISEGVPSAKKYATGNRPMKGTFGLYVGTETNLFQDVPNTGFNILPIVNLKYMITDNFEARLGMKFWKQRETLSTENDANADNGVAADAKYREKYVTADNQIRPGFAYHFTKSNLLDVYAGIEGIIGWTRDNWYRTTEDANTAGKQINNINNGTIQFGAGAFIGLQAFIARLPLAIGLEYGISTLWDGGIKSRAYYKDDNTEYTVYDFNPADFQYVGQGAWGANTSTLPGWDRVKGRKGQWGNQIRLTLSYYFNR